MKKSYALEPHISQGQESPFTSVATDNLVDFCQAYALKHPVKKVQADTGLSKKQVENIRQGLSSVSGKTLTNWIKNDRVFAGCYAEFVGLILPGEAGYATAITQAVSAYHTRVRP